MSDPTITAIFATVAAAILGWLLGYLMGRYDGRALARAESATCQKATNPSQISSEPATPGLRTDNPMAEPVMGGLPRHEGEKLGTPAKQPPTP